MTAAFCSVRYPTAREPLVRNGPTTLRIHGQEPCAPAAPLLEAGGGAEAGAASACTGRCRQRIRQSPMSQCAYETSPLSCTVWSTVAQTLWCHPKHQERNLPPKTHCLCCLCNKLARHWFPPKTPHTMQRRRDTPGSCRARSPALHVGRRDRVASYGHVHRTRMLICMHIWGSSLHLSLFMLFMQLARSTLVYP